ncbi:DUF222 domain-containing protein [Nocardioides sp. CER19]|uniref:DUF222 domain-containing protein n=1 Tax=Nocardioides sp. CER19 TaxID=3038538 RepID=UPI00244B13C3|nr:DUF222 domain-containing protein [Nocardioides sp. CER19]MDH2413921.1 DUF222 domain-containing protein [Nocardioides sp. CER19]
MVAAGSAGHPVLGVIAGVRDRLKGVADVNPTFMDLDARRMALLGIAAARAQLDELELRVVSAAAGAADRGAARDVAGWLVVHGHRDSRTARADARLAHALDRRHEVLRRGMAEGRVHLDQAHVIARALDDLPTDLAPETLAAAEAALVELANRHTPKELRRLGRRVWTRSPPTSPRPSWRVGWRRRRPRRGARRG